MDTPSSTEQERSVINKPKERWILLVALAGICAGSMGLMFLIQTYGPSSTPSDELGIVSESSIRPADQIRQAAWRAERQLQIRRAEHMRKARRTSERDGKGEWKRQLEGLSEFAKVGERAPKGSVRWHAHQELKRMNEDQPQY